MNQTAQYNDADLKKSQSWLIGECDRLFSLLVRQHGANNGYQTCCTCGTIKHWRKGDCGHWKSRRYKATRWLATNTAFQCKRCNGFGLHNGEGKAGESQRFEKYLRQRHGDQAVDLVIAAHKNTWKPTRIELAILKHDMLTKLKAHGYEIR